MKQPHETRKPYETFENLQVYQAARVFRKKMYLLAASLPRKEEFGLVSQMRRAAVSLTNNIAEGHGRFHFLDQIRFMFQARGSLEELLDDLNVCEDESYAQQDTISSLREEAWSVHRLLNGYIRFLRSRLEQDPSRVNDSGPHDYDAEPAVLFNSSSLQPFNE